MTAQEYYGGHLDWYAFDANAEVALGGAADNAFTEIACTAMPAPVSFRGAPAMRFWEFEDAQVDFGSVDAGPTDLVRMLLVEYALNHGDDWFVIPIELDVGAVHRTRSLVITDTFGVRTLIKSSGEPGGPRSTWRMFQPSYLRGSGLSRSSSNLLFLPPSLLKSLESRPIEEVRFLRDEMANMAWAVEHLTESPAERPLNRADAYLEQQRRREREKAVQTPLAPGALRYCLSTEFPTTGFR